MVVWDASFSVGKCGMWALVWAKVQDVSLSVGRSISVCVIWINKHTLPVSHPWATQWAPKLSGSLHWTTPSLVKKVTWAFFSKAPSSFIPSPSIPPATMSVTWTLGLLHKGCFMWSFSPILVTSQLGWMDLTRSVVFADKSNILFPQKGNFWPTLLITSQFLVE